MKHIKTFEDFVNENVNEGKDFYLEVSVRDAKKALNYLNDEYRNKFKTSGSNKYSFKKEDDAYNALQDLEDLEIEVIDSNLDESIVNEASKKYKKGDRVQYQNNLPASGILATSKVEKSKNVKTGRIVKASKAKVGGYMVYTLDNGLEISDNEIIGLDESIVNEGKYSLEDIRKEFAENPYGIGANTVEDEDDIITFRFSDSYKRDEAIKKLKSLGYPTNKIGKSKQDRAYQYRYELIVSESIVNESKKSNVIGNAYTIKNGFTFTTIDGKKFTIPRKAQIEIVDNKKSGKETYFTITKGKLDGYPSAPRSEFGIATKDLEDYLKSGDIELNESEVNEAKKTFEEGDEFKVKASTSLTDYYGAKDYDIEKGDAIEIDTYKKGADHATIIIYTRNGGATRPFKVAVEDIEDLIEFKEIVLEYVLEKEEEDINEAHSVDMQYSLKAIKKYNSMPKPPSSVDMAIIVDLAEEIMFHLGYKGSGTGWKKKVNAVVDHLYASMDNRGNVPVDKDLVNEIIDLVEEMK